MIPQHESRILEAHSRGLFIGLVRCLQERNNYLLGFVPKDAGTIRMEALKEMAKNLLTSEQLYATRYGILDVYNPRIKAEQIYDIQLDMHFDSMEQVHNLIRVSYRDPERDRGHRINVEISLAKHLYCGEASGAIDSMEAA